MEWNSRLKPRVRLISHTNDPYKVLYLAITECTTKSSSVEKIDNQSIPPLDVLKKKVKQFANYSHGSVLEHVTFTFAIDNMSRTTSHQIVRHRIASYSQKSQRYVDTKNFIDEYIIPVKISNNKDANYDFIKCLDKISEMITFFKSKYPDIPNEEVRYSLPNATKTSLVLTMNTRELLHFFSVRCCSRSQFEIRYIANQMLEQCKEVLPEIFENAGPPCVSLGICLETKKFSCGKAKTLEEIKQELNI